MVICYAVSLAWRDSFSSGSLAVCLASYSKDPYELNEDEGIRSRFYITALLLIPDRKVRRRVRLLIRTEYYTQ